jgi:hypothetical protein
MHGEHGVHLLIHVCFHIRTTFEGEKFSPCQPCLLRQNRRPQRNKNVSEVTDVTKVTFTFASHLHRNIPFNYLVGHVITSQMMFSEAFLHISSILFPSCSLLAPFLCPSVPQVCLPQLPYFTLPTLRILYLVAFAQAPPARQASQPVLLERFPSLSYRAHTDGNCCCILNTY